MIGNKKGFSLIEVLIVVLVLAIIIGAGTGVFVSAVRIQRYNFKHEQVFSQISYITEYMSRAIKTASSGDGICIPEGESYQILGAHSGIKFVNSEGDCQEFYLDESFYLSTGRGRIYSEINGESFVLTDSENFDVSLLNFNDVMGNSITDNSQPRITMVLEIRAVDLSNNQIPKIKIQTTISKRNLDI